MPSILQLHVPAPEPARGRGRPPLPPEIKAERERRALEAKAARERRALETATEIEIERNQSPVDEARAAFGPGKRLSAFAGLVAGGFPPLASYTLIHREVAHRPEAWALVIGGLIFSALNMFGWMRRVFDNGWMALGWVVILEGTMSICDIRWLSLTGLVILIVLDGVTAAMIFQRRRTPEVEQ